MKYTQMTIRALAFTCALTLAAFTPAAGPTTGTSTGEYHAPDPQLRSLITILLDENPVIRSVWAESRSRYQRVDQARSLPDPMLAYRYFVDTPETRVGPQEHALEISQGLPWGSKRRLQGEQARLLADSSTWEAAERERTGVARLKKTYFEAAYLQEAITVLAEERTLLKRFEEIALTRYATGKGIQQSIIKVQTDISRLDEKEFALKERLDVVQERMAELIGRPGTRLVLSPITLPFKELNVDAGELETLADDMHPAIRAVESRIEADRTWARRRVLEKRPDFRVGLGYTLVGSRDDPAGMLSPPPDNGNDILGVTFGVNIPLYRKRIRAGIAEAEHAVDRDERILDSVRNDLRYRVQKAATRLESVGERGHLYATVIIPQAEQALSSAEAAYSTGRLGFLDLLDAERILFQSRLAFHRLVSDIWIAASELEEAIGRPFPMTAEESSE
jgi:outer membrane protein TolC